MKKLQQRLDRFYLALDRRLGGWPTLLIRTGLAFDQDDGAVMSRSIAYYALFSLFPLLLVLISFAASFLGSSQAQQLVIEWVARFLPTTGDLVQINSDQIAAAQSTINILALLGLFWSASGVFTATYRSVNRAWGNPKSQLFWSEKLFGLAVVMVAGLLLLTTTVLSTVISVLLSWRPLLLAGGSILDPETSPLWNLVSNLLPIPVSIVAFILLYRIIPRNAVSWRDVWLGGLLAGLVWELARRIYAWYLSDIARYNLIYGSVGAIIGFLLWSYLSAMILLIGAEFTAQHTAWRRAGKPPETRPLSQWLKDWTK